MGVKLKRKIKKKQEQQIYLVWISELITKPMIFCDLESLSEFIDDLVLEEELGLTEEFFHKINIINIKEMMFVKSIEKIKEGMELKFSCISPAQYIKVFSEIEEDDFQEPQ